MKSKILFPIVPCNMSSEDARQAPFNLRLLSNLKPPLPELNLNRPVNGHRSILIIGGGPTLTSHRLQEIDDRKDVLKVLAGSAHRLLDRNLLKNGANVCVFSLPGKRYLESVARSQPLEYWLAAHCDPEMIDRAGVGKIRLWYPYVSKESIQKPKSYVGTGSTAATAALALALYQGYSNFEFYGVDGGTYKAMPGAYSYDVADLAAHPEMAATWNDHVVAEIGGKFIKMQPQYWNQAEELSKFINVYGAGCSFTFHGDSLNNLLFNQGLTARLISDSSPDNRPDPIP